MTSDPSPEVPRGEITSTECKQCGTQIFGVDGRYACQMCGWVNHWSEGLKDLPTAEDDPDWPGHKL